MDNDEMISSKFCEDVIRMAMKENISCINTIVNLMSLLISISISRNVSKEELFRFFSEEYEKLEKIYASFKN